MMGQGQFAGGVGPAFVINALGQRVGLDLRGWAPPARPAWETMVGGHCRLEPTKPARDAEGLYEAFALDATGADWTYLPYGPFATTEAHRSWMEQTCAGVDPLFFTVFVEGSPKPLGLVSFLRIFPESGSIEIGHIHFGRLLQRTAAATEAIFLLIERSFALGYRRCEWKCDALNAPSRVAAQRFGFSYEGVFRQATVYKGRTRDTAWYSIVDGEWPALRAVFNQWLEPANFDAQGRQQVALASLTLPLLKQRG